MSVVQIPNLGAAVALNGTEQLEGVQAGTSVKLTIAQIGTYINAQYPPPGVSSIATSAPITGGTITTTGTIGLAGAGVTNTYLATMAAGTIKANATGGSAQPTDVTPSAVLDIIGTSRGSLLYRGASVWSALAPSTAGYLLATNGIGADPAWVPTSAALPDQAGNTDKFLQTDGTTASWQFPVVAASSIVIGTTAVTSGTSGYILYDNAGILGELATTGGGSVVRASSPTLVTPNLGTPTAITLTNGTGLPLSSGVTGNLPVTNLNSGTSASATTFWRGDGTWASPAGAAVSLGVGSTAITGGSNGRVLYDNSGTLAEYTITGTAGSVVLSGSPAFTGVPTIAGAASGTIGLAATAIAGSNTLTLPAATDTLVARETTDTLKNKTISGADNTLSNIGNSSLTNSSITINGSTVALGGSTTVTAAASSVTVGTTTVASGTDTYVLYNNAGTLGNVATTGTGNVVRAGSPALTGTPTIAGATSGTIGLVATAIAGSNTLTLPAATDTLVARETTDTLKNKTISGADNTLSNIGNSSLTNSSITVNGTTISLGASGTITAAASSIVVGTTSVSSGTTTRVLYDNAGTLGEYAQVPIANGGTGEATASAAFNALSPITSAGDLILGNGANSATRLAIGNNGYVLTSNGTTAAWAAVPASSLTVGSTTISSGTDTYILYNNAGTLGNVATSGTGNVARVNTPTFTTPVLGAATGTSLSVTGNVYAYNATSIPAGGTTGSGYTFSSTANFGMFFGSGAPTLSAAQGSLYVRSDGAPYYNNNGTTGWTQIGAGITAANDGTTASNLYPLFASSATGTLTTVYTNDGQLNYKPSTGELTSRVPIAGNGIVVNSQTVSSDYTIASGYSGMSAGPITVAAGKSVTVTAGSKWVVL